MPWHVSHVSWDAMQGSPHAQYFCWIFTVETRLREEVTLPIGEEGCWGEPIENF